MRIDRDSLVEIFYSHGYPAWLADELVARKDEFLIESTPALSPEGVSEIMKRQGQRPEPKPEPTATAHVSWSKLHNNYKVQIGTHRYFTHDLDDAIRYAWRWANKVFVDRDQVRFSFGEAK